MTLKIFDGHNDVLTRTYDRGAEGEKLFVEGGSDNHIDVPRARAGGFAGGIFAIMTTRDPGGRADPARSTDGTRRFGPLDPGHARRYATAVSAWLFRCVRSSGGVLKVVRDADELKATFDNDPLAVVLHFEGAEPIDTNLNYLEIFYEAGLRSLGLVWSRPNAFAEGVPFAFDASPDTGPGLTAAGRDLVEACNELGIAVDLSHLNAKGFWDVAGLSTAPLIASHSNAHALCPATRNLTDEQLGAVAASGGIVGVNFATSFLRADGKTEPSTELSEVVRHFEYLVKRMGVDHVGFGSDYDGTLVPEELKSVEQLPALVSALRETGFTEAEMNKLASENWLRVLGQTWR